MLCGHKGGVALRLLPVDQEGCMGVVVLHVRVGNVVFHHRGRQFIFRVFHREMDDGVHILTEIRIAAGQAVEQLMRQDRGDRHVNLLGRQGRVLFQRAGKVDLRAVGVSEGAAFFFHGGPDKHDGLQRRHFPAVVNKGRFHNGHAAVDQFLFRVCPVQHLLPGEIQVFFHGHVVLVHNESDLVLVKSIIIRFIGQHQFPAFLRGGKPVWNHSRCFHVFGCLAQGRQANAAKQHHHDHHQGCQFLHSKIVLSFYPVGFPSLAYRNTSETDYSPAVMFSTYHPCVFPVLRPYPP